ncbi:hypothetical protein NDN08_005471 [Rhodosorus marinus]|uniref:Probable ATP-dependent transporter ycf16 n=1 Tax=Rhodosorus marinus TaxID=101924 RepID=A0AAV8V1Q0_9RHOD|nr:hypothetical protein NDN08_005471 [Rhodosorus marinus]
MAQAFSRLRKGGVAGGAVVAAAALAAYRWHMNETARRRMNSNREQRIWRKVKDEKQSLQVDKEFAQNLFKFLRVCVPGIRSKEFRYLIAVAGLLLLRSYLDIWISDNGGEIVKAIVGRDKKMFIIRALRDLGLMMFPIAAVNNLLKYTLSRLKVMMRKQLSLHFHEKYLDPRVNTFYKVSNLDSRIRNIDQLMTTDVERFCTSSADLYSNLSKPLLDIVLFTHRLSKSLGLGGPSAMIMYFSACSLILRAIQPPFGALTAEEQRLEGDYRLHHSRLITHSEEIAFYGGSKREKLYINMAFDRLMNLMHKIFYLRFWNGIWDSLLVKYMATIVGYCVVSAPIFFKGGILSNLQSGMGGATEKAGSDDAEASEVAAIYTKNSRLLISLAGAIGRIVLAGKEITRLTGFCNRVATLDNVLSDIQRSTLSPTPPPSIRASSNPSLQSTFEEEVRLNELMKPGVLIVGDEDNYECPVKFDHVNLISPDRTVLCQNLTFEIPQGVNVLISGPNGCGKSSLFRVLAGLWPLYGGTLTRPTSSQQFYVPQRPYLALGTLRDQVTYPLTWLEAKRIKGATDETIIELLNEVHLGEIAKRKGGLDVECDWADVLSGGQKQRLAMARLFFHRPKYAILDECTSAVSLDVEGFMYTRAKELGITLITVSHRPSLWKFHEKVLKFDGSGGYEFRKMMTEDIPPMASFPPKPQESEVSVMGDIVDEI